MPRHLSDEMGVREITAEISALTKRGRGERAVELFKSMLADGAARPNDVTLLCAVRAAAATGSAESGGGGGIHALVIKLGADAVVSVRTALIGLYSSLRDGRSILQLYNQSKSKDLVLWSAAMSALSKNSRPQEALDAFRQMLRCGNTTPNFVSAMAALSACGCLKALSHCRELHGYAVRNFEAETNLQNSLVDVYAKCDRLDVSMAIFGSMEAKDGVSWNTVICRCTECGKPRETLILFLKMMRSEAKPEENVVRAVLNACSQTEELEFLLGIHCYAVKAQASTSPSLGTALLRAYAEFNRVDAAGALFGGLRHRDVVAWSTMVSVYARSGCLHLALEMFRKMQSEGEEPNEITFVSLLRACSSAGAPHHGRTLHAHVLRLGICSNEFVVSGLIDLYCKLGMLRQGKAMFDALENRDLVSWSSMINGYGINGHGEDAVKTYLEMLEQGLKPNGVIFVSLLSACSHCGLVDEGLSWFYQMESTYGLKPELAHYSCIVDMLSRQGRVKEALEFIKKMPLKPDVNIWGALFTGCRAAASDVEVAEVAACWLVRLDPGNSSYYVALSNLYAKLGQWRDAERIRQSLGEKRLRKTVGYSVAYPGELHGDPHV